MQIRSRLVGATAATAMLAGTVAAMPATAGAKSTFDVTTCHPSFSSDGCKQWKKECYGKGGRLFQEVGGQLFTCIVEKPGTDDPTS